MGGSSQCSNCTVIILFNELAGHSKHICYNTAYSVDLYKEEATDLLWRQFLMFFCAGVGGVIGILQITTVT